MIDWTTIDKAGWTEQLDFKAFKDEEEGTIEIHVTEQFSTHRMMVHQGGWISQGWNHRLTFYAYEKQRPGTQMIFVAFRGDPERCILLNGGKSNILEGWERGLEFWVPK